VADLAQKIFANKIGAASFPILLLTVSRKGTVFSFRRDELTEPQIDTEDLALDWGNTLFVVGVSLVVVVAVLFVYPSLRARLSGTKPKEL
jgi:hypothetical protein